MTYRATQDVVRRVMPLLERVASRTVDKARVLQYLSAMAGVDWGVHELVAQEELADEAAGATTRQMTFRDRTTGAEHALRYPACLAALPPGMEPLLIEEYKRLAADRPLTTMAEPLFRAFFAESHCARCRWQGQEHRQIQLECRFAGYPINFEPVEAPGVRGQETV